MHRYFSAFLIAFAILMAALFGGQVLLVRLTDKNLILLQDGWDVTVQRAKETETEHYEGLAIERLRKSGVAPANTGDVYTLTKTVDTLPEADFPAIQFNTRRCATEVFWDDALLYSYETDELSRGITVGNAVHFITLPEKTTKGELKVVLYATDQWAFFNVQAPQAGEFDSLTRGFSYLNIIPLVMGIFLLVYGMGLIIMMTIYVSYLQRFETHIVTAILCVVLGGWILCKNQMTAYFAPELHVSVIEYVCLFFVVPLLYIFLIGVSGVGNRNRLFWVAGVSTAVSFLCIVLHVTGGATLLFLEIPYYTLGIIGTGVTVYYLMRVRQTGGLDSSEAVRLVSVVGLSGMNALSILIGCLTAFFGLYRHPLLQDLFPVGAAFFVMMQMVDYFIYVTGYYAKKEENTMLSDVAYTDVLTGLPNRAEWDLKMDDLEKAEREYCILSCDLNGLKHVNDTAGHMMGDKLLREFAQVLKESFRDEDFCARIGGDEFVVIMEDVSAWQVDTYLKYLDRRLADLDRRERGINHSCACGYAFKKEAENPHAVYMLADTRMYERKAVQKGGKGV